MAVSAACIMGVVFSFLRIYSWTLYLSISGQAIPSAFGNLGLSKTLYDHENNEIHTQYLMNTSN